MCSSDLTTIIWVTVTLVTPPTDRDTLLGFYRLVRPAGPGWAHVAREAGVGPSPDSLPQALLGWVCGCSVVYAALFGVGSLLYGHLPQSAAALVVFVVSGYGTWRVLAGFWANGQGAD